jgi:hypothetical protein
LSKRRWIFRRKGKGKWIGYADKVKSGMIDHCIDTLYTEEAEQKEFMQTRLTIKGVARLACLLTPQAHPTGLPAGQSSEPLGP